MKPNMRRRSSSVSLAPNKSVTKFRAYDIVASENAIAATMPHHMAISLDGVVGFSTAPPACENITAYIGNTVDSSIEIPNAI